MSHIYISGNAVVHCMLIKLAGIDSRISEQMGISPSTGKKRSLSTMYGILAHIHTKKHNISRPDFKILSTRISEADLLVRESADKFLHLVMSCLKVICWAFIFILNYAFRLVFQSPLS